MPIINQSNVVATFGEFGEFESVSGGSLQIAHFEHYQAGAMTPNKLKGTFSFENFTIARAFVPERDAKLRQYCERYAAGLELGRTCTVQYRVPPGVVVDQESKFCKVDKLDIPDGKSGSNEAGMITLTLTVDVAP